MQNFTLSGEQMQNFTHGMGGYGLGTVVLVLLVILLAVAIVRIAQNK